MWKQALAAYLKPAFYKQLRGVSTVNNTFQEHVYMTQVVLAQNGQNTSVTEIFVAIVQNVFKICMQRQFQFDFFPVDPRWPYRCSRCDCAFARHVKIVPCGHLICERCISTEAWAGLRCCACGGPVGDVTIDTQIFKEQLEAVVRCVHCGDRERVRYMVYREEDAELGDPELASLMQDFNENRINIGPINALRNAQLSGGVDERAIGTVTGFNRPIQLCNYVEEEEEGELEACEWTGCYKEMPAHLQNECGHCVKTCSNFECAYRTKQFFINAHLITCAYRQMQCPVCYATVLRNQFQDHITPCLRSLRAYITDTAQIPAEYFIDVDLELKLQALSQRVDGLASLIVRWDNSCYREVVQNAEEFDAPRARKVLPGRFFSVLSFAYDRHASSFSILLGFAFLGILNITQQAAPFAVPACALAFAVLSLINLALFLLYACHYVLSNRFRSTIAPFMFTVYYIGIFNCAVLYTLLEFHDMHAISAARTTPFVTFLDMLYFSGITGAGIGLGDVVPKNYVLRLLTVVEIWYTQLICRIVFRGLSFFFKVRDFEYMKHKYTKEDLANL